MSSLSLFPSLSLGKKNSIFSFSLAKHHNWKKEHRSIIPDRYKNLMILIFYSASCEDWTTVEDSTWWGFYSFQLPILHKLFWVSIIPHESERLWNEGKQGSFTEILHTLPPPNILNSFLPAPQLNVTRTTWSPWRGFKTKKMPQLENIMLI